MSASKTPQNKVSLEDLLHLKRHERPAPQFWQHFDRELHAKTLQSLVQRKDHQVVRWGRSLRKRFHVLAPSMAVAALTLFAGIHGTALSSLGFRGGVLVASDADSSATNTITTLAQVQQAKPQSFVNNRMPSMHRTSGRILQMKSLPEVHYAASVLSSEGSGSRHGSMLF